MRKRRFVWAGIAVGAGLAASLLLLLTTAFRPAPINRATCHRLSVGMMEQEVEAILRRPAGPSAVAGAPHVHWKMREGQYEREWGEADRVISVLFDPDGRVANRTYVGPEEGRFRQLARRVGVHLPF
jgi:hypothetical protein